MYLLQNSSLPKGYNLKIFLQYFCNQLKAWLFQKVADERHLLGFTQTLSGNFKARSNEIQDSLHNGLLAQKRKLLGTQAKPVGFT